MTGPAPTALPPPSPSRGEVAVAVPPAVPESESRMILTRLLPAVMAVGMLGVTAVAYRSGSPAARSPVFALFPLMMLTSAVAAVFAGRNHGRGNDIDDDRENYLAYLAGLRKSVADNAAAQRAWALWSHPEPDALWLLAGGARMWERRLADPDFGSVRVGIGPAAPARRLVAPSRDPVRRVDPVTDAALRRFLDTHAVVPDVPVVLTVLGPSPLLLDGDIERARGLLRALICQLAVLHGPDALRIAAVDGRHRGDWDWLKWLPHHQHPSAVDAGGPLRLAYPDLAAAETSLAGCRAVVVSDDAGGLQVTELGARGAARRLHVTATVLRDAGDHLGRPDFLPLADAAVCARRLAGHRPVGSGSVAWAHLLGIDDIDRFDAPAEWARASAQSLCVPIGTDSSGEPVRLDIKEAAERGSGPHGLCVGATGSGKSEFLRTLVLGMTARHSPAELNVVLVDFKGGATFLGFERTRHVCAVITNLAEEASLVERMRDALSGEMQRRQQQLRAVGAPGIAAYRLARTTRPQLPSLPALLVIIDEFSELLHQHPDLLDTFVAIGRLGRSLGMHLLLASQRLDEGRLRGLESHLSYRVCLKTMSAAESRIVLGTADAHELPNIPGVGFLRTADGAVRRFQTAYVSGICPPARADPVAVLPFTAMPLGPAREAADVGGRTVLQAMLQRLSGHGPAARQIWLAPLGDSPMLGALLDADYADLTVPIGVVDRPFEQRRTTLSIRLDGAAGHVAVVGAPQSGKSTALCTLIAALCATHNATRVAFYCLDFGGGELSATRTLPHVGAVAGVGQPDLVQRVVAEMEAIVARRESQRAGYIADGERVVPDVFLVIDGWSALCREFEVESRIVALAARGLSSGVHVMLAASRWAEVRPALRDLIGTRIELRLGDPAESELDRRQAQRVPQGRPGRGLTHDGMHMLLARPQGWEPMHHPDGAVAPPIRLLPTLVARADLPVTAAGLPVLGIDERELATVAIDFGRQPHLLIVGGGECGKTSVLRTLCRELVRCHPGGQAQLLVVDYRRGLLDVVPTGHLAGYAMSRPALTTLLPGLIDHLARRMPGADLAPQQLRAGAWWTGPQLYVVVDDHDLVAAGTGGPLTPLLEYLPHAADLGLHLIVACRGGGAGRSMYEPLLTALTDMGAMTLMMSGSAGSAADTPWGSVRPTPLPPGRGILATRSGGERLIQVAWEP
ncbi:type VII secretion protein EccCb [Mycolicibacter heraklionensis]|uniref:Type VII secretion protein EccCb n=1 Tax=Mycolicibacter heraklionensis TaxID=512402 RepID=A0AA91EUU3_9MYCO|nr:type VII secretion protein EccCb [Mycolicibacter heraklionensis]OBK81144.1 type VII secretion protein EccCb [Mycolicibacter heraklionensis]